MKIVKISTNFDSLLMNQTPWSKGIWKGYRFVVNEKLHQCDYWVVFEGLKKDEESLCPKNHVIFITGEPPSFRIYNKRFLRQFSILITCHRDLIHSKKIYHQQGLPWHLGENIGKNNYDYLKKMKPPLKKKLISVISSNKAFSGGHRKRLAFVSGLKKAFNDIDIYGWGINDVKDKWSAIVDYKYHIALENSSYYDYWTEKLSDAYLGFSYPFYYGCKNIENYFPVNSYTVIDINNVAESVELIKRQINEKRYEKCLSKIIEARGLVLDKYNLFPMLVKIMDSSRDYGVIKKIELKTEAYFDSIPKKTKVFFDLKYYFGRHKRKFK